MKLGKARLVALYLNLFGMVAAVPLTNLTVLTSPLVQASSRAISLQPPPETETETPHHSDSPSGADAQSVGGGRGPRLARSPVARPLAGPSVEWVRSYPDRPTPLYLESLRRQLLLPQRPIPDDDASI